MFNGGYLKIVRNISAFLNFAFYICKVTDCMKPRKMYTFGDYYAEV